MAKLPALLLCSLLVAAASAAAVEPSAPGGERAAVLAVVDAFFKAMHSRDDAAVRDTFAPKTRFAYGRPDGATYALGQEDIEEFSEQARKAPEPYIERIWSPEVLIDGRMAVVWARYDFHRGGRFSHNGRDCYVLLKTGDGWKIVSLVFTVEPGDRTEHPSGPPK